MKIMAALGTTALVGVLLAAPLPAAAADAGTVLTASDLFAALREGPVAAVDYDRDRFAEGIDVDADGCNTRRELLIQTSIVPVEMTAPCTILTGEWYSTYDGATWTDPAQLEMDHLVSLKETWISGAHAWTDQQRADYANDLDEDATLALVTSSVNNAKGASDPASWLPPLQAARCEYVADWIVVKFRWSLSIDSVEKSAIEQLLVSECSATTVTVPVVRADVAVAPPVDPPTQSGGGVNPPPPGTHRLAGPDRFSTAVEISRLYNPGVPVVYIATGINYPDALSASAAAAASGGPLLLVLPTSIPDVVKAELTRLAPQRIVIVGGEPAVSSAVQQELSAYAPNVRRVAGVDRYETSRLIARDTDFLGNTAIIATGLNFPDALTSASAAAKLGGPVILIYGAAASLDASTLSLLRELGITSARIAGGTGVVSSGIEQSLLNALGGQVQRFAGADRYQTGALANTGTFSSASTVYLSVGTNYADALAGGALAGLTSAPLFIVQSECIPTSVMTAIRAYGPSTVVLLGSTSALSPAIATLTECALPPEPPQPPGPPANPGDTKNCGDFATWRQAQDWFERYYPHYGDIAKLDGDNDRIACESLPGAP